MPMKPYLKQTQSLAPARKARQDGLLFGSTLETNHHALTLLHWWWNPMGKHFRPCRSTIVKFVIVILLDFMHYDL